MHLNPHFALKKLFTRQLKPGLKSLSYKVKKSAHCHGFARHLFWHTAFIVHETHRAVSREIHPAAVLIEVWVSFCQYLQLIPESDV